MIPQATIERILDAANIVDVVSDYVTLRKSGANYKGLCPFHDDKTPSFSVSPSRGLCKCFSCGQGGNAVHFIMELEQLTYVEALKFLAKKYGIEVEERELTEEQKQSISERESLFAVNEWACSYYNDLLQNNIDGRTIGMAYFRNRGFRDDIIEKFQLGFAMDKWDNLATEATKKGFKEENIVKTGLCYRKDDGKLTDRFRGRVMFPWFNVSGKVVAFGGRVLDSRTKGVSQKYVNSPESSIYSKGKELYGLYQAKKMISKEDRVYMVEGYTDVISMHQCGIENVVANSGTALTHNQITLLHRYTNNITLLYDGDDAGIHAALRGTDMLLAEGMNVKILLLPDGDDPDSFARKHNATEFKEYVEEHQTDFIIFKTNLLVEDAGRDPIKRANLTKDIIKSISVIPEEISRSVYVHECAELLNMDEAMLLRETNRDRLKNIEEARKEAEREIERAKYLEQKAAQAKEEGKQNEQGTQDTENGPAPMSIEEQEYFESIHAETPPFDQGQEDTSGANGQVHIAKDVYDLRSTPKEDKVFIGIEQMIMQLLIKYGEQRIAGEDEEGNATDISLIRFVYEELSIDNLTFRSPLYMQMLEEANRHVDDEGFLPSKFFSYNQNLEFSKEAVELMSERYKVKLEKDAAKPEDLAGEQVVHLMLDYKYAIIKSELDKCKNKLKDKDVLQDQARCMEVMQEFQQLNETQRLLAKRLGDRIFKL